MSAKDTIFVNRIVLLQKHMRLCKPLDGFSFLEKNFTYNSPTSLKKCSNKIKHNVVRGVSRW